MRGVRVKNNGRDTSFENGILNQNSVLMDPLKDLRGVVESTFSDGKGANLGVYIY